MNLLELNNLFLFCEEKNKKLYDHMERVSMLCYATAKELSLTPKELELAYISGLLHDVSKFVVDLNIDHYSIVSSTIISFLNDYQKVSNIILQSEERFDGKGYPLKLKNIEIELLAYILIISNYYDELRMQGLEHNQAIENLYSNSNLLFPNQIIVPFVNSIEKNDLQNYEYMEE